MGIVYNKHLVTKDRTITPTGPRDRQRKQADASFEIISDLRAEIKELRQKLDTMPARNNGEYTAEQVNEEIEKALKEETKKLNDEIKILKEKVSELREELKEERAYIKSLRSPQTVSVGDPIIKRPEIAPVFVDPVEQDTEVSEKKFKADTVSRKDKDQLTDKVNKLKNLLGKK